MFGLGVQQVTLKISHYITIDYKKALEIDPSLTTARQAVLYLPDKIKEQNEKLKEEMLGRFLFTAAGSSSEPLLSWQGS